MPEHRITYRGPAALAVDVATALADAEGIALTASGRPVLDDSGDAVLSLTVDAPDDAVVAALDALRALLPDGATVDDEPSAGPA